MRKLLDTRASELDVTGRALERERKRLGVEFAAKVGELSEAKKRLESQVSRMEDKEQELRRVWSKFESEKAAAVEEAEGHLAALARVLAAGLGVELRLEPGGGIDADRKSVV